MRSYRTDARERFPLFKKENRNSQLFIQAHQVNETSDRTNSALRLGGILGGIGAILIGFAALLIAGQWNRQSVIRLEGTERRTVPPAIQTQKNGFALVSFEEGSASGNAYRDPRYTYYLLDKDSGRVWKKGLSDSWNEVDVEGITP